MDTSLFVLNRNVHVSDPAIHNYLPIPSGGFLEILLKCGRSHIFGRYANEIPPCNVAVLQEDSFCSFRDGT